MMFPSKVVALSLPLIALLQTAIVQSSPLDSQRGINAINLKHFRRQDPGPESAEDPSGIEPEDEDQAQILADGTDALRKGKSTDAILGLTVRNNDDKLAVSARGIYTDQPTATWFQVDTATSDAAASFTAFTSTSPDVSPIPKPDDPNQIRGPNPWNVDHIFELQVIGEAFKSPQPTNIPSSVWASASSAVFTKGAENSAIASAVTNLNNLKGIPNALNSFKKQVFTGNLTGKGGPSSGDDATFFNFFGPAIQKYLSENQNALMAGTVNDIGNQLSSIGNADVQAYFTAYASSHYQGCIDFLSTWSGRPRPSTSAPATTTAAAVTCEHAADPQNTCAAIADSQGWCDCGDSSKYVMQSSGEPCAWSTLPATTSFDCATTTAPAPTSTCVVPAGCTNEAAPDGCAIACT
ncbi:hypothetical protein G7Y79_00055g089850 [Physcia stellaris]|nr:hypothetical protein G7Y79_00055g089850 [Physcia stellaris]